MLLLFSFVETKFGSRFAKCCFIIENDLSHGESAGFSFLRVSTGCRFFFSVPRIVLINVSVQSTFVGPSEFTMSSTCLNSSQPQSSLPWNLYSSFGHKSDRQHISFRVVNT